VGKDGRVEWFVSIRCEVGEDIFGRGKGDVLSAGPRENPVAKGIF